MGGFSLGVVINIRGLCPPGPRSGAHASPPSPPGLRPGGPDGRVWAAGCTPAARQDEVRIIRDYYLERKYPQDVDIIEGEKGAGLCYNRYAGTAPISPGTGYLTG